MILAIGRDKDLLYTRVEVLRKADTKVFGVLLADVEETLREKQFELIILCHTLSEENMAWVTGMALETQGKIKIMRLESFGKPTTVVLAPSRDSFRIASGPEMLVETVRSLLASTLVA